jgi:hypothetical protein
MTDTPKWQTKPYKITGWICIILVSEWAIVDIVLAIYGKTISQGVII